jgi:hypothetical protein
MEARPVRYIGAGLLLGGVWGIFAHPAAGILMALIYFALDYLSCLNHAQRKKAAENTPPPGSV